VKQPGHAQDGHGHDGDRHDDPFRGLDPEVRELRGDEEHERDEERDHGQAQLPQRRAGRLGRLRRHRRSRGPSPRGRRDQDAADHPAHVEDGRDGRADREQQVAQVGRQPAADARGEADAQGVAVHPDREHPQDEREQHGVQHRVAGQDDP
jgi:hypothetical protein